MMKIRVYEKLTVFIVVSIFTLFLSYPILVLSDFFIGYVVKKRINETYLDARMVECSRLSDDLELIREAKSLNFKPIVYPSLYENGYFLGLVKKYGIAPLAPQPNVDVYYCNEGYGLTKYHTDRFGFRNDDDIWDNESLDIVLIGDSFVHGACVSDSETISYNLNQRGFQTLNLGVASNGPIHYTSIAKVFLPNVRSENVVVAFYPNDNIDEQSSVYYDLFIKKDAKYFDDFNKSILSVDLLRLYHESSSYAENYTAELHSAVRNSLTNEIKRKKLAVDEYSLNVLDHLKMVNVVDAISLNLKRFGLNSELPFSTKLAIDIIDEICVKNNSNLIILYIPNSKYWRPDNRANTYKRMVSDYVSKSKTAKFLDSSACLRPYGIDAYSKAGPHLSPLGYEVVSDLIAKYLCE